MSNDEIINLINKISKDLERLEKLVLGGSSQSGGDKAESKDDEKGTVGVFDGENMVTDDGKSYQVSPNYAAKSKLVPGDTLKMTEKGDKNFFKQIKKVDRKRVEGITTTKEGILCVLTEFGSHKLSPTAVEHNDIKVNEKIYVILPEANLTVSIAIFDDFVDKKETSSSTKAEENKSDKQPDGKTSNKKKNRNKSKQKDDNKKNDNQKKDNAQGSSKDSVTEIQSLEADSEGDMPLERSNSKKSQEIKEKENKKETDDKDASNRVKKDPKKDQHQKNKDDKAKEQIKQPESENTNADNSDVFDDGDLR